MGKTVIIGTHEIELTKEEKELFPKQHITKHDLITYYQAIAYLMLPHLKDRPIAMERYPLGIDHEGFFQKNEPDYFPSWIKSKTIVGKTETTTTYIIINNEETLIYLANQYCITPHIWLSTTQHLHHPDKMVFDLDPSGNAKFQQVRWVAKKIHAILQKRELVAYPMTTGSRGLHLIVPLEPLYSFEDVRAYALQIAQELAHEYPAHITLAPHKKERGNKIYIDTLRNSFGQLTVAPYAVRAKPGAPIATPIAWHELDRVVSQKFTVKNIMHRLTKVKDVWHGMKKQKIKN